MSMYILVANSTKGRVLVYDRSEKTVTEANDFVHVEGRERERFMGSDHPGRHVGAMSGSRHGVNRENKGHSHETDVFARQVSDFLEQQRAAGLLDELILIAPAKFLGTLRQNLSEQCAALVTESLSRNLTASSPEEIVDHVTRIRSRSHLTFVSSGQANTL